MEPSGDASGMQSWRDRFPHLSSEPRIGQRELFDVAASEDHENLLAVLPTGYGKTFAGAGYYAIRRARRHVNRLLWLVSSDAQREQLCPDPRRRPRRPDITEKLEAWFGVSCLEACIADQSPASLRMHWENRAEVFVATYQQQGSQRSYFRELLDSRGGRYRWLVIGDEAHRLGDEGKWGSYVAELPRAETLYMSATPLRVDGRSLRGVPERTLPDGRRTYKARVEVSWQDAIEEGAIREPRAHAEDWQLIDLIDRNGEKVSITTTELANLGPDADIDAYLAKRDLRFSSGYAIKVATDAVARLNDKRSQWPGTHQLLGFALSCRHAEFLAEEILSPIIDADWIGVRRPEEENKKILNRYQDGRLSALIQVSKAGEGFDNPPSSVLLFMNLNTSRTALLQQLGRGIRRIEEIPKPYDICDVFADTAHPVIEVVRELNPDDRPYREDGDPRGPRDRVREWEPLPDIREIEARWLSTQIVTPAGLPQHTPEVLAAAERYGVSPEDVQSIVAMATGQEPKPTENPAPIREVTRRSFYEDRVARAMVAVTSHAVSLLADQRARLTGKEAAGLVKTNLNKRWVRDSGMPHKKMLSEDFQAKYDWLQQIDTAMHRTGVVPPWLLAK